MYRDEVPAYGILVELVRDINHPELAAGALETLGLTPEEDTDRITQERHGAIRLSAFGTVVGLGSWQRFGGGAIV